ncbi:class I SAM-dependent methyltransferase [Parasphingorhabdus sp.]|uniref:class I SAM-dependent methyltransferase n=1 Tax=Parasphingorhabdus sp. TaxID=2709688 RepID=UPI0039E4A792
MDDVLDWENGSRTDPIRTEFVIPFVSEYLNKHRSASIVDIGAATGHLSREISRRLSYDASWTLVDSSQRRLDYAAKHKPETMKQKIICSDVLDAIFDDARFEAVLVSFSLLELGTSQNVMLKLSSLCTSGGSLILIVPDVWQDILAQSIECGSTDIVSNFLNNPVNLTKVDRFTGVEYPFFADRLERIIDCVMQMEFSLTVFTEHLTGSKRVYGLIFKNQTANG